MLETTLQRQKIALLEILHAIFGKMHSDVALQQLNRNRPFRAVMAHVASPLHPHQHDTELLILDERFGASTGFALPGRGFLQLFKFIAEVTPDHLICEFRKAGHACLVAPHMYSFCFWPIPHYHAVRNSRFRAYAILRKGKGSGCHAYGDTCGGWLISWHASLLQAETRCRLLGIE